MNADVVLFIIIKYLLCQTICSAVFLKNCSFAYQFARLRQKCGGNVELISIHLRDDIKLIIIWNQYEHSAAKAIRISLLWRAFET